MSELEIKYIVQGRCYCGQVSWEARLPETFPHSSLYCHCASCRRAHASPIYQVTYLGWEFFRYTSGEELTKDCLSPTNPLISRQFSTCCGTRTVNKINISPEIFPQLPPRPAGHVFEKPGLFVGLFPGNIETQPLPDWFTPSKHVWCEHAIYPHDNVDESIPKFQQFQ